MNIHPATLGLLLATMACASQPDPRDPDRVVTAAQAPTLCEDSEANPSLSPDGNTLAWMSDQNLRFYDLTTGAMTMTSVAVAPYGSPPVFFSPDGRYAAYPTFNDSNGLIYVVDRSTARRIDMAVPVTFLANQVAWSGTRNTFAIMLSDFTILVYDPTTPGAPILQVAPPDAFASCSHVSVSNTYFANFSVIEANMQRAATICYGDVFDSQIITWSYASGIAVTTGTAASGTSIRGPLLPYPDLSFVSALTLNPTDPQELLLAGLALFTVDASKNFQTTRMLDDEAPSLFTYTSDGKQAVGVAGLESQSQIRAWRLADSNPYFTTRDPGYETFTLSNNNILGACNSSGAFHIWYLSRLDG